MGGKELAQKLNDLDKNEPEVFVNELSKHPLLLEDISDRLDPLLRKGEPARNYGDFARELRGEGLL